MSGICDTCRREPCHMRFDGCKTCDVYEGGETRWEQLFGTPERAARTLMERCSSSRCPDCPICHDEFGDTCELPPKVCAWNNDEHAYDALLEWLRGDAE